MSEDGPEHLCVNANSCADEVGCRRILTFQSSPRETGANLYTLDGKNYIPLLGPGSLVTHFWEGKRVYNIKDIMLIERYHGGFENGMGGQQHPNDTKIEETIS